MQINKKYTSERVNLNSLNLLKNNKNNLIKLFPSCFEDGIFNNKKLRELIGDKDFDDNNQKYNFTWNGKDQTIISMNYPSINTLNKDSNNSINFDDSENIIIEGDNLEVLKILTKSYLKKVDIIYIDPPYNTGKDFIYKDDFKESLENYKLNLKLINEDGQKTSTNQKTTGRKHTNWLNMIYPRLALARNLLKNDGVIFISIDDNEQARLKLICDEIFGEENFVSNINWQSSFGGKNDTKLMPINTEYILCYSRATFFEKNIEKENQKFLYSDDNFDLYGNYSIVPLCWSSLSWYKNLDFIIYINEKDNIIYPTFEKTNFTISEICAGPSKLCTLEKIELRKDRFKGKRNTNDWCFYWSKPVIDEAFKAGFIEIIKKGEDFFIYKKTYEKATFNGRKKEIEFNDNRKIALRNIISDPKITSKTGNDEIEKIFKNNLFSYPKPIKLIKKLLSVKNNDILVLDFFAGSGTTGQAVMDLNKDDDGNRKFILIQIPEKVTNNSNFETISNITRERIKKSIEIFNYKEKGFKFFKLSSSNFKKWDLTSDSNLQVSLLDQVTKIKENSSIENIMYEIILKMGLTLNTKMKKINIDKNSIFIDENNYFIFAFDNKNYNEIQKDLIKYFKKENLEFIKWIVFSDEMFLSNSDKINCIEQIKLFNDQIEIKFF